MKNIMKVSLLTLAFLMHVIIITRAQGTEAKPDDASEITRAALDYIDGYYSGDAARIQRAVHPDLNKATPRDLPQTGRTALSYTTYSGLVEFTRAQAGALPDTARHIEVIILSNENDVANVKVISANFTDFIQLVKLDGDWKILNVIFSPGSKVPPRIKDFNADMEKAAIEKTATIYLYGLSAADAGSLDMAIDRDFNKITLNPVPQTGKTSIRRQRYDAVMENAIAGVGKQDEVYRNNRVYVLDIRDGIAVVRCESAGFIEYVQMYKGNGQWKIFNSISRPNTALTLEQAMTVTAGKPMPDFTLPVYNGGEFTLSALKGKNVLLIFPRGWTGNQWCSYCPYQYLELEQLEKESGIMDKYNLEIVFVMPYGSERIKDWMEKFPDALQVIETIKNPQPRPAAGTIQADYADWAKTNFPLIFDVRKDDPHNVIPVLIDENRFLSRQLKIFTGFWDGISAEQNIASVFIIDRNGILQLKYIGQMTEDRPDVDYLLDFIRKMN